MATTRKSGNRTAAIPKGKTPPTVLPKRSLRGVQTAQPSDSYDRGSTIPSDRGTAYYNEDISTLRAQGNTLNAIYQLARIDPTNAGSVWAFVQMAMSGWRVTAYNSADHTFSFEGTQLARSVMMMFDTLYDYSEGFSQRKGIDSVLATLLREVVLGGGAGLELVLNKSRLPDYLMPVSVRTLEWVSKGEGRGKYPQQRVSGGDPVALDIPTFWVSHLHEDAGQVYSRSMMEAALNTTFHFQEFLQDVRRVIKRSGHDRLVFMLNHEKVVEAAPAEIRKDAEKLAAYLEEVRSGVESMVGQINPEDAIVAYDIVKPEMLHAGQGVQTDYTDFMQMLAGLQASSVKTPPSILGLRLGEGSQSVGNIESLIFVRLAAGIQVPVKELMSRALTLAVRLMGADVYVKFEFKAIDLRPESELAAFRQMETTDILRKWSLGLLSDEEAAHLLDHPHGLVEGVPSLAGTMFMDLKGGDAPRTTPGDTPAGKALQPDKELPRNSGGSSQDRGGKR